MSSRLWVRASLAACLFLGSAGARAVVTYDGTDGVAANFFESNTQGACTGCHFSPGSATYANVVLDNFSSASTYASMALNAADWDDGVYDGTTAGNWRMPQGAAAQVTEAELTLLRNWINASKPRNALPDIGALSAGTQRRYSRTLSATVSDNGLDTSYVVEWRLTSASYTAGNSATYYTTSGGTSTSSAQSATWTGGGTATRTISHTVTGLSCGQNYEFRVRGVRSGSTVITSAATAFSTAACPSITTFADKTTNEDTDLASFTVSSSNATGLSSISYALDGTSTARNMSMSGATFNTWSKANMSQSAKTTTSYPVTITATYADSGEGSSQSQFTFNVNVTPVNDAPVIAAIPTQATTEGASFSYGVSATDIESDTITYSLSGAPTGMTIIASSGLITWNPVSQYLSNQSLSVTVRAQDNGTVNGVSSPASSTQSFTINVTADNDPPVFSLPHNTSAAENLPYVYDVNATDPENQTLTFALTVKPAGMSINPSTGVISWTPPQADATYTENVTVTVTDGTTVVPSSFQITVTSSNDPPVFSSTPATLNATEGVEYSYDANASDPEGGTLTYSLVSPPTGMTIDAVTGVVRWTPPQALADYTATMTVRVSDGANAVTQSFTLNVSADNDAPSFSGSAVTTVDEDEPYSYDVEATDPENQTLTFALTVKPTGMSIDPATGVISWTRAANYHGTANVTVTVSDGSNTVPRSFTVTVVPVNDAPTITSAITPAVTQVNAASYSYDVNGADVDGDTLYYSLPTHPAGMTINTATGLISWSVPATGLTNPYAVVVQVADRTDATALTATQSFGITVQDSDGDKVADFADNCVSEPNTNQANNDLALEIAQGLPRLGDACDPDDDNDGVSDVAEEANGYDPMEADDHASLDKDGDGLSNLDEFEACQLAGDDGCSGISTDSVAPVISPTPIAPVVASGYFTPLDLSATATDLPDGVVPARVYSINDVVVSGSVTRYPFRPGSNKVVWRAEDAAGNVGEVAQFVVVKPIASIAGSAVARAGRDVSIPVRLSGKAPAYPVTATFAVTGATAGHDYLVVDGDVTFASAAQTEEFITLRLPDLGPAPDKTLLVTLNGVDTDKAALADASQLTYRLTVTSQEQAPKFLALTASQNGPTRQVIYKDGGNVTVAALVVDQLGEPLGCASFDTGGLPLASVVDDCVIVLDPSQADLQPGVYEIAFTASQGGVSTSRSLALSLRNVSPVLSSIVDSDGDGIANSVEDAVDANGNGLLDYLDLTDDIESPESIQVSLGADKLLMVAVADSGLRLRAGRFAIAAQGASQAGIQIFETQVATAVAPVIDADYAAIGAIYDFEIDGLSAANRTAHVVLPLPIVLLPGVQWRQLSVNGEWIDFFAAGAGIAADGISSAPRGEDGQCPGPQSARFVKGFVPGMECIQLTLTDGGPNDADGEANGRIRMTGAAAVLREEVEGSAPESSQTGGSADAWLLLLLALATTMFRRKETL